MDARTDLVDYGNKSQGERKPVMEEMVRENTGRKKGESRDLKQEGTYDYLGGTNGEKNNPVVVISLQVAHPENCGYISSVPHF